HTTPTPTQSPARPCSSSIFFVNAPATTEIYTLSLHDALPISVSSTRARARLSSGSVGRTSAAIDPLSGSRMRLLEGPAQPVRARSEEHTSELQSRENLVCRLLLEKKK